MTNNSLTKIELHHLCCTLPDQKSTTSAHCQTKKAQYCSGSHTRRLVQSPIIFLLFSLSLAHKPGNFYSFIVLNFFLGAAMPCHCQTSWWLPCFSLVCPTQHHHGGPFFPCTFILRPHCTFLLICHLLIVWFYNFVWFLYFYISYPAEQIDCCSY